MMVKRAISLLLSALILMTTVVAEPLSLVIVQAAKGDEQEGIIFTGDDDITEAISDETADMQNGADDIDSDDVEVEDTDTDGGEIIVGDDNDNEEVVVAETDEEDQNAYIDIELSEQDGRTARAAGDVAINATNFPDRYLRAYVSEYFDGLIAAADISKNPPVPEKRGPRNGILSLAERNLATQIDVSKKNIENLKGIEHFPRLTVLICYDNRLSSVDLSKNTELRTLSISNNNLTRLDLSKNTKLTSVSCRNNKLTSLNLNNQTQLTHLECQSNNLGSLDVSKSIRLDWLDCSNNNISTLNLSVNTKLDYLACAGNKLTSLNIASNTAIKYLDCRNNQLTSLNTNNNPNLFTIACQNNKITSLNLSNNHKLIQLLCNNNNLQVLEIPNAITLEYLEYEGQTRMNNTAASAKEASGRTINVTWSAVSGATGYEVYRRGDNLANWEIVSVKEISGTSYRDAKVILGETYNYRVYAFQKTATAKRYLSYAMASNKSKTTIPTPQKLKTSILTAASINVSWDRVSGVSGYTVYAATSKNGTYRSIGDTKSNNLKHMGLKAGTTYYYKVRAYVQLIGAKTYSGYTAVASRKQIVPKVTGVKVENRSADSLRLRWKRVSDSSGYEIYQATSKKGKYKKIATIKKSSTVAYAAKKLSHKKTYYYKIKAFKNVGKTKKTSSFSKVVGKKVILAKPILTAKAKNKTSINLRWKKVAGAKQYEIYRATSKKGKYKKIATTKSRKFTNTKLKKNRTYFYKIKAVEKIGKKTYRSAFSARRSARTAK